MKLSTDGVYDLRPFVQVKMKLQSHQAFQSLKDSSAISTYDGKVQINQRTLRRRVSVKFSSDRQIEFSAFDSITWRLHWLEKAWLVYFKFSIEDEEGFEKRIQPELDKLGLIDLKSFFDWSIFEQSHLFLHPFLRCRVYLLDPLFSCQSWRQTYPNLVYQIFDKKSTIFLRFDFQNRVQVFFPEAEFETAVHGLQVPKHVLKHHALQPTLTMQFL